MRDLTMVVNNSTPRKQMKKTLTILMSAASLDNRECTRINSDPNEIRLEQLGRNQ
jgi:hypothetical protein